MLPLLDKVQYAIDRVRAPQRLAICAAARDLGIKDAKVRQALHGRRTLTVGIPQTVKAITHHPSPEEILDWLNETDLNRQRTSHHVQMICACGYNRPIVASHITSVLSSGTGQMCYKGIEGAVVQLGMMVIVYNGTALDISFAPYAARGRACSGSSSFSASSGVNRGMGKIPASWRASRQASATSS